jgi:hypothetical protein
MYPRSVRTLQADALLVSALPRSDELNGSQIRRAVMVALHDLLELRLLSSGCE